MKHHRSLNELISRSQQAHTTNKSTRLHSIISRLKASHRSKLSQAFNTLSSRNAYVRHDGIYTAASRHAILQRIRHASISKLCVAYGRLKRESDAYASVTPMKSELVACREKGVGGMAYVLRQTVERMGQRRLAQAMNVLAGEWRDAMIEAKDDRYDRQQGEVKVGKLVKGMVRAQTLKITHALHILEINSSAVQSEKNRIAYVKQSELIKNQGLRSKLVSALVHAQKCKHHNVLDSLIHNLNDHEMEYKLSNETEKAQKIATCNSLNKIIASQMSKASQAIAKLHLNMIENTKDEEKLKFTKSSLLSRLQDRQLVKLQKAYMSLRTNFEMARALSEGRESRTRSAVDRISIRCSSNNTILMESVYIRLKSFSQTSSIKAARLKQIIAKLLQRLISKQLDGLNELRYHNLYSANKSIMNETLISSISDRDMGQKRKLLKALYKAQAMKCLICLRSLNLKVAQQQETENRQLASMNRVLGKCQMNYNSIKEQCYRKMINFQQIAEQKDRRQKAIYMSIMRRLEMASRDKELGCFSSLARWSVLAIGEGLRREKALTKSLARLKGSLELKVAQALRATIDNMASARREEQKNVADTRLLEHYLISKSQDKIQLSLNRLRKNSQLEYEKERKIENLTKRLLIGLIRAYQLKSDEAMHSLLNTKAVLGDIAQIKKHQSGSHLARLLKTKSELLTERAWRLLSINLREQLDKEEQVNNATEVLIRGLLKSQASKALAAFRLLEANKVSQHFITETLALKTRNCLNRMNRSLEAKSKAFIYALVENRDMIVENESNRMKVQIALISKLKSHRVVDLLVRAYQDKQRQSLAKLKFNRDTLSDTEGAKRKRLDALMMSLFNKTIKKSEDAWSKLMTNNRQVQLKDQAKSIKRSAMIQALISSQKMKAKLSFLGILLQNRTASNEAKKIMASKSMAVKRLEVASKAKIDRAFRYLFSNELIRDKHDIEVKQRKSRVMQKLIDSHINKSKVAIKKIKNISDDARARQKKRDLIMGRLSHTLAIAQQAKVRETWQPLVKRSLLKSQTELSKNQKIRACLHFLRAAQLSKARQAREKLFKHRDNIKNSQDHSRSINLKAISTLISALKQKVRLSYAYLKTRNQRQQARETLTRGLTNKLIRLLVKQQHLKKRHALDRLVIDMVKGSADTDRAHSATEMAKLRRLSSIKKAMWRLVSKQTRKLGRSMAMMIEFSHRISKKDKVLDKITTKLIANQRAKMNKSLAKMSHISLIGQADSDRRQSSIKSLARNIERATRDKKRLCFLNLVSKSMTDNSRGLQLASIADRMAVKRVSQALEAIRFAGILDDEKAQIAYITTLKVQEKTNVSHKMNRMLDKLADSRLRAAWRDLNLKAQNKAKLEKLITRAYVRWLINRARGFDKLENWRIYTIGKERMLETIFEKANIRNRHMMKDFIGRLLDNRTKSTLKQEKLAKVLQAGNLRAKSSQKDSFAKLKEFIKTLRSQQDAMLRATSMMGMLIGKQITKAYYSSLICQLRTSGKRADKNKEFAGILGEMFKRRMREVVRSMLKYGRHMQYSKQEKTHIKDEALRTIVHLIGRNHTWAKGQYFEVLSAKPRMSDLSNILRALVRTRLYQSFSHMRLISNLDKRDRMIKSFNVLEINLAKAMKRRKRQTIDEIKAQFLNYNPWEKRIIKTWVFNTTQTLQHAFWRMRYVEDAGAGLVSVDKNIKLKRLAAMVKRIEYHGMAKCFDAVMNYSDIRSLLETEINTGSQRLTMEAGETLQFQDLIKQYGIPRDRASTDNVFRGAKVSRTSVQDKDNYRDDRRSNTTTFHSQITNSKAKITQGETKVYDDWGTSSNKNASASFNEDEGHLDFYSKKHSTPNMMSSIEKSTSILKKPENMKFAKKSKPTENSAGAKDSSVNMRVSPGYSVSFNEKALSVDLKSDKLKDEDAYAQNIYDRQQTLLKNKASPVQRAVGKEADDDREGNIRTMHDSEISGIGQFSPSSPQKTTYKQKNVHSLKGLEQLIAERETPLCQKSTVQITEPLENRTKMSPNGLLRKQNQKNSTVSKLNLNSKADSTLQDLDSGIQGPNSTSTKRSARNTKSQTQSELMSEITPKKSLKTLEDVLFRKK